MPLTLSVTLRDNKGDPVPVANVEFNVTATGFGSAYYGTTIYLLNGTYNIILMYWNTASVQTEATVDVKLNSTKLVGSPIRLALSPYSPPPVRPRLCVSF